MKSISKFISLALLIAAATACNTKEIDKPDIPDQPQISGNVKFTASMKQTRVEYSVNGDKLHQCWEENDVIYGFYGDNPVGKVTLKVTEVDADEYATLEATDETEGAAFIAAIKEKGTKLKVGLLYTGSDNEVSGNTITVDMSDQSEGRIPACIESSAIERIIEDEESGDTIVYFDFFNDCAILEIQSLTGIAEESTETIDLKSVSVSGVDKSCTFTYDAPGFSQDSESGTGSTIIVSSSDDRPLKVDSDGNIIDANGNSSCIRIAVCPNIRPSTITITATSTASHPYISQYQGSLYTSECYIIRAQDVVAKTSDGQYFTTVNGAFVHAAALYETAYNTAEKNIVTLLRDCGIAGVDESYIPITGGTASIDVDGYKATFDLNGHTLTFAGSSEYINVAKNSKLVITDSKSKSDNPGKIYSNTVDWYDEDDDGYGSDLVWNRGELIIEDAVLWHNQDMCAVVNTGEGILTVNGGKLISEHYTAIYSDGGKIDIYGGFIESRDEFDTIQILNGSKCTISGGVIYSAGPAASAVYCFSTGSGNASTLTITWPNEIAPSSPEADTKREPFIYCPTEYYTYAPVYSFYQNTTNTAQVTIKGGYIITTPNKSTQNYEFYCGGNRTDGNLVVDDFGGFYTNTSWIHLYTSGTQSKPKDPGNLNQDSGSPIGNKTFKAESGYKGFEKNYDASTVSTGPLYYITEKL